LGRGGEKISRRKETTGPREKKRMDQMVLSTVSKSDMDRGRGTMGREERERKKKEARIKGWG